ncbi:SDR family NAD(P)-dependent oxidoreductase, partial [Streptomyces sp. NRRL S-118]|uniref:SDR family NAD(P)-dependent oxidoreductase n=1 Tax=Streptomyces sp. NRRL S-118 TaxID=1463881 RepID=UPI000586E75A
LVDLDDADAPEWSALLAVDELQLAVRNGRLLAPRLGRAPAGSPRQWSAEDRVLITGGTGGLGALVARHLVERGVRDLVLVSRRGPSAPGARELTAALEALGAQVWVAACDVSDREQVARLVGSLERPLTAVVH